MYARVGHFEAVYWRSRSAEFVHVRKSLIPHTSFSRMLTSDRPQGTRRPRPGLVDEGTDEHIWNCRREEGICPHDLE